MTALAKERMARPKRASGMDFQVAANVKIWKNAWLVLVGGYVKPALTATGLVPIGRASENADNTGGSAGAITVHVDFMKERVFMQFLSDPANLFVQTDIGSQPFMLDDQSVTTVSTGRTQLPGRLFAFVVTNTIQTALVEVI
jgi:hypothetical protein